MAKGEKVPFLSQHYQSTVFLWWILIIRFIPKMDIYRDHNKAKRYDSYIGFDKWFGNYFYEIEQLKIYSNPFIVD